MGNNLNILVTGGAGFLGSHIADELTGAGHNVTLLDTVRSPYLRQEQKMIIADILDYDAVHSAMRDIDVVFHLAALADINVAQDYPLDTMKINILGTTHVLEAVRQNNVKRIIFASTIYVYSRTGSFYRVSKHAGELLIEEYHERFGVDYTILRFGTLYGTRASESNSIHRLLREALINNKIEFYGTGKEVREYIHVVDAAKLCVEILDDKFNAQTLILTGPNRMRLAEILDMINEILGNKIKVVYHNQESKSHYTQTPYSYIPRVGRKIVCNPYCDLGQSLVEILHEIDSKEPCNIIGNKEYKVDAIIE